LDFWNLGGAGRDRTDDLIVANDNVPGSSSFTFQSLTREFDVNQLDLLERIWNVRKPVVRLNLHSLISRRVKFVASIKFQKRRTICSTFAQ
jgi:hypothetical protein